MLCCTMSILLDSDGLIHRTWRGNHFLRSSRFRAVASVVQRIVLEVHQLLSTQLLSIHRLAKLLIFCCSFVCLDAAVVGVFLERPALSGCKMIPMLQCQSCILLFEHRIGM